MNPETVEDDASQAMRATWWSKIAEPPPGVWWDVAAQARMATRGECTTVAHREAYKEAMTTAIRLELLKQSSQSGVSRSVNARLGQTVTDAVNNGMVTQRHAREMQAEDQTTAMMRIAS